jgi:hypothetical protein
MRNERVILMDDIVLPGANVHLVATQLDLTVMTCLARRERTRGQWETLGGVGLVIEGVWMCTDSLYESILVVKRK